jgi:hypothetical protein
LKLEGNSLVTSGQLNAGELLHLKSAGAISNSGDIVLQGRVQIEAGRLAFAETAGSIQISYPVSAWLGECGWCRRKHIDSDDEFQLHIACL